MDDLNLNIVDPNEMVFTELKKQYPSLSNVNYKSGNLEFPNGNISLLGIDLSLFPPEIFNMTPENLYIYLSNKFYLHIPEDYHNEINSIFNLFTQLIITEEEKNLLKRFAYDFWLRNKLLVTEPSLADDLLFQKEYYERRKVMTKGYENGLMAASILTKTYNDIATNEQEKNNTSNNIDNNQSLSPGISLVRARTKGDIPPIIDENPKERMGIAGFTSTILILVLTIGFGVYIALQIMK